MLKMMRYPWSDLSCSDLFSRVAVFSLSLPPPLSLSLSFSPPLSCLNVWSCNAKFPAGLQNQMTSMDMHACCCRERPYNLPAAKCAISIIAQGLDGDICPDPPPPSPRQTHTHHRKQTAPRLLVEQDFIGSLFLKDSAEVFSWRASLFLRWVNGGERSQAGGHGSTIIYLFACLFFAGK